MKRYIYTNKKGGNWALSYEGMFYKIVPGRNIFNREVVHKDLEFVKTEELKNIGIIKPEVKKEDIKIEQPISEVPEVKKEHVIENKFDPPVIEEKVIIDLSNGDKFITKKKKRKNVSK